MATNTSRENRRRKIVDRGSDRLALISGRVPKSADFDSSGAVVLPFPLASAPVSPVSEETSSSLGLPKNKSFDAGSGPALDGFRPSLAPSPNQPSPSSAPTSGQGSKRKTSQLDLFTHATISFAISSTEHTRLLYSAAAAVLVVLSNLGFPLLGSRFINSLISFKPLFLLLLTNMTVVTVKILDSHGVLERADRGENNNASSDEYAWADQLGKTLEVGMVMQKAFDAVAMDCSLYAVIIICGLCFT